MRLRLTIVIAIALLATTIVEQAPAQAQDWGTVDHDRDRKIVDRLLGMLENDPLTDYAYEQLQRRTLGRAAHDELVERYRNRLAETPDDTVALILLARLSRGNFENERALTYADHAREAGVEDWRLDVLIGEISIDLGRPAEAEASFELALSRASSKREKLEIWRILGEAAWAAGRTDEAMEHYRQMVEIAPKDRHLRWELGAIFADAGRLEEALEQYTFAAKLAGRNVEERSRAELEIAGLYSDLYRFADAIATYDAIIGRTKEQNWLHQEARFRLVEAFRMAGDLDGLLVRLDHRLTASPRDPWALALRAQLLYELGRDEESLAAWALLMERSKTIDHDARDQYLSLVRGISDRPAVTEAYRTVMEKTPNDDDVLALMLELANYQQSTAGGLPFEAWTTVTGAEQWIRDKGGENEAQRLERLAETYLSFGHHATDAVDRARAILEEIVAQDPSRTEVYTRLLTIAFARGDTGEEARIRDMIFAAENFDTAGIVQLADLYTNQGRAADARAVLETGLERRPDDNELLYARAMHLALHEHQSADTLNALRTVLLQTDDPEHLRGAATAYFQHVQSLDAARETTRFLEEAWATSPHEWRRGRLLFLAYLWTGEIEDALAMLSTLQAVVPSSVALEDTGLLLIENSRPAEALLLLRSLARKEKHSPWKYHFRIADVQIRNARSDLAIVALEAGLESAAGNGRALARAASIYSQIGHHERAVELVSDALREEPRDPSIRLAAAKVIYTDGTQRGDATGMGRVYQTAIDALVLTQDPALAAELLSYATAAVHYAGMDLSVVVNELGIQAESHQSPQVRAEIQIVIDNLAMGIRR